MPVVAKTLRPCPEPKSTISGWTLTEAAFIHFCVNPAKKIWLHHQQLGGKTAWRKRYVVLKPILKKSTHCADE
jgi:hypothetical protein